MIGIDWFKFKKYIQTNDTNHSDDVNVDTGVQYIRLPIITWGDN